MNPMQKVKLNAETVDFKRFNHKSIKSKAQHF
jgi:hypothetical protein